MIYYFRDHLGKGVAPLEDIEAAISDGTLSGQTLVSVDRESWQSVESAKKPPALPPQPAPPQVQYVCLVEKKKKTSRLTWLVLVMILTFMLAMAMVDSGKTPDEDRAQEALENRVRSSAVNTATALLETEQRHYTITPENDYFELSYIDHRAASIEKIEQAQRDLKNDAEIEMIPSTISSGGFLLVTVRGWSIGSARPEETTVVVVDDSGREITREKGDWSIPNSSDGDNWWSIFAVSLPEPIGKEIRVRISNSVSQRYADFTIRDKKQTEQGD